jgi:hypothetical protein
MVKQKIAAKNISIVSLSVLKEMTIRSIREITKDQINACGFVKTLKEDY